MRHALVALVMLVAAPVHAAPVAFPPDAQWTPFHCGGAPMTDPQGDDAAFLLDLDLVGNAASPAGFHAADANFLYLRIRLDADPAPANALGSAAWGYEFDLDGNPATYELLVIVDGITPGGATVALYANTTTTIPNSPTDPATTPALATYPFAMNARSIAASGSSFGGTPDFFLDFAVPWTDLMAHGLDHATAVRVWAGSSGAADTLDGDIACHDGTTGAATLDGTATAAEPADPGAGSNGSGGSGVDVAGAELVGGDGCQIGGSGGLVALAALGLVLARSRRRRR
jgi:hypothetical protein